LAAQQVTIPRHINKWTAIKLEHLDAYLQAYVTATKKWGERYYIDAFAGCGDCLLEEVQLPIEGSPWRALRAVPPFSSCFFIDQNKPSVEHLSRRILDERVQNAHVFVGDCNRVIPAEVLPRLSKSAPSFAFLDPTGPQLDWQTVVALAEHRSESRYKMELLILYPYDMAIKRLLSISRSYAALDRFYGGRSIWEDQLGLSLGGHESDDGQRARFLQLYKRRLRQLGYRFVDSYGPLCDGRNPKYHVIFAGDNETGSRIMRDVWGRTRFVPGELGYHPVARPRSKSTS
jgi:three-Cys-motif partner protein